MNNLINWFVEGIDGRGPYSVSAIVVLRACQGSAVVHMRRPIAVVNWTFSMRGPQRCAVALRAMFLG
jgi:hypothetical protein